jgi:hypothetical protein
MASEADRIRGEIDKISRSTGLGSLSDAYGQMLAGINHRGLGNPINSNQDNSGIILFTRPDLNLSYDNLSARRTLMNYASNNIEHTLQRYCRVALDPRGSRMYNIETPLFRSNNWFIPLLTNNLLSMSGWPDRVIETFTSTPGVRKEVVSMVNGMFNHYGEISLTANFRNIVGNPVPSLLSLWLEYCEAVFLGEMLPYPHSMIDQRMDYTTRIYVLILDPSRRFVQSFATTLGFPTVDPTGARFNHTGDEVMMQSSSQISINFLCNGLIVNDPLEIHNFNRRAQKFDPGMEIVGVGNTGTIKLKGQKYQLRGDEIKRGNYQGIPIIHPYTQELMWFVSKEEYDELYT